jgi:hypothetical protein
MVAGAGEEFGVALRKGVTIGTQGVGVDLDPSQGVGVGVLTGDLVLVCEALGEGVGLDVVAGTHATSAATSRIQSAEREPLDKSFMGRLLSSVSLVLSNIVAYPVNHRFQSELPVGDLNLLPPSDGCELPVLAE